MEQRKMVGLANWIESLGREIAQDPDALLSKFEDTMYLTGVGDKYESKLRRLSDSLLKEGGWSKKLSSAYLQQRALQILAELANPLMGDEALPLLKSLSETLDAYNEERTVYVALSGVKMTDIDEIQFGSVTMKKMTETQKEEIARDFETKQDKDKFFQRVRVVPFVEFTVLAEPIKAWEIVLDERLQDVLDLLRYSMPFLTTDDLDPDINLLGRSETSPPLVAVCSGKVEDLFGSLWELPTNLEISQKTVEEMDAAGVFQIAEFMNKETKTNLERKVLRGVQWASGSQDQREPENELLSLIVSLESLLPSRRDKLWTAEATAILLERDTRARKAIKNRIAGLYKKRNAIVHGGESTDTTLEDVAWLRRRVHELIKVILNRRSDFETLDGTYTITDWLEDYKLAPKSG